MVINLRKAISSVLGFSLVALGIIFMLYGIFGMDDDKDAAETQTVVTSEIDVNKPMIALTYDDGPYTPVTGRILEALKSVNGRATFYVVGNRIEGREEITKRIVEYGCEIGNHTYTHTRLNSLSQEKIKAQLQKTDTAVYELTGYQIKTVRPPEGGCRRSAVSFESRPFVMWTVDTLDWSHQDADKTVKRVLDNAEDGDIVLMHDLFSATADASEKLIPELAARGFQLVTVSELIEYRQEPDGVVFNSKN